MTEALPLKSHRGSSTAFPLLASVLFLFFVSASVPSPLFVDWRLDPHQDEDGFRHAAVAYFDGNEAVYELKGQLWADAEKQPIEDVSVDWPVEITPYLAVATVSLPRQAAHAPERVRYFDEVITFRPAHSLAARKALGSVMRGRLQVYAALSAFHHRENGVAAQEPSAIEQIPA